jgi:vacuolar-type H+-ATPase catalytic subunit A/Vma1
MFGFSLSLERIILEKNILSTLFMMDFLIQTGYKQKLQFRIILKTGKMGKVAARLKHQNQRAKRNLQNNQPKQKKNTEIANEKSAVKDLTKSECVSLICLTLSVNSSLALEIYQGWLFCRFGFAL